MALLPSPKDVGMGQKGCQGLKSKGWDKRDAKDRNPSLWLCFDCSRVSAKSSQTHMLGGHRHTPKHVCALLPPCTPTRMLQQELSYGQQPGADHGSVAHPCRAVGSTGAVSIGVGTDGLCLHWGALPCFLTSPAGTFWGRT